MTIPDTHLVDLRVDPRVRAGALAWDSPDVVTGWHHHPYHQLEYALAGVAEVETERGSFLLARHLAMWIPAGAEHNTTLRGVRSVSLFIHPDDLRPEVDAPTVIGVAPVLREMIHYATRWPIDRAQIADGVVDHSADAFFAAIGVLLTDAIAKALPLHLPAATDALVERVLRRTLVDLPDPDLAEICRSIGLSERTLRRRIRADIGMSWADYVAHARLMRAMALLAGSDDSVIDIAATVGFASPSGFTKAFRRLSGTTPAAYRKRTSS